MTKVFIGYAVRRGSGFVEDHYQAVEFDGEYVAEYTKFGENSRGDITEEQGVTHRLYRLKDGRQVVHEEVWSTNMGDPRIKRLFYASASDLAEGGRFEGLGSHMAVLTLDEGIRRSAEF